MRKFTQITFAFYISLLLTFIPLTLAGQNERWYTSDGELSSSLINDVFYDSRGMLWVATEDGLNRFDGSKFTNYRNVPNDPNAIKSDHINNISEDDRGRLFICTHDGIQVYNPATDKFSEPIQVNGQYASSSISDVVQTKDGELWAVGNETYLIKEKDGKLILEHADVPDDIRFIYRAATDAEGNIWFAKDNYGLYRKDASGKFHHYFGNSDDPVIVTMAVTSDGNFFAGSHGKGLFRYNPQNDKFENVKLEENGLSDNIQFLYPDEKGNLLIGTDGRGLKLYNYALGAEPVTVQFTNIDSNKLKVHSMTKDSYGNLWVGVYQKGLLKVPKVNSFFMNLDQRTNDKNLIGTCCVTALVRDKEGTLWVGTDNDDIFAVDLESHTSKHYTIGVPKTVMGLFEDSRGTLWLGSYNRGCGTIDKNTGIFKPLKLTHRGIDVTHVYDFAEDIDGNIWIATMGAGIFRHSPTTGESVHIDLDGFNPWVTCIEIGENNGNIYAGTYDGFFIISPDGKNAHHIIPGKIISAIHQEPDFDDVWVGARDGLVRIHNEDEVSRVFTTDDGLPSSAIYAIEHGDDALWISTNHGLSKFNVKDEKFTNFNVDNGLPNNEFSRNSSFKDQYGNIFFGGINGITSFQASQVNASGEKLTLRVTDFFIGDQSINAGMKSGSRTIIDVPLAEAETFKLSHSDNSFTIRINTKEFVDATQAEFYYAFDDKDWTKIQNNNSALGGVTLTFSNVASGKHKLKVKAINGGMESDELGIVIDIDTVWYATWWAKLLYILIIFVIAVLLIRHYRIQYKQKRAEEQRQHKAEIIESKLQFFTNISHEIRTPLSLVIGPLQKLQDSDSDTERNQSYKVIMRNAQRILRLVNELMDLRKIDNKLMKLRFTKVDLRSFVNDIYETFRPAASQKNITFTFTYTNVGHPEMDAWIDKNNFDKIVMNLLSNAIKFTPEGGSINLSLKRGEDPTCTGPLKEYAEIAVTDSGIGIAVEDRDNIFNRFFQGSNNTIGGTGIGLHLTRELVELHHGSITVAANPTGKGTIFTVRIPLGHEHLTEQEISQANDSETSSIEVKTAIGTPTQLAENLSVSNKEENKPAKSSKKIHTIYIVEDDEEIRNYLVNMLGKTYHTAGFSNGKLALDAIHKCPPTLVITDVMMPEMDGITLTKKIKQNIQLNHIPVLILTAKTREEDNIEAMESGAATFITKPFNIEVLTKTVQNQIESVQRLRNAFSGNQKQEDRLEEIEVVSNDDKLMERVMKVINKNLSNSDITVETIAREIGISRVHLHRKLKELTNQSTRDFIRNIRLQAAAKLLRDKKITVAEVSDLVGFKQPNNFSTCFKEMFGMSPTAYASQFQDRDSSFSAGA